MWGNSGLAEELLASQEELSSGVVRLFYGTITVPGRNHEL
jgi:hypothetical protein